MLQVYIYMFIYRIDQDTEREKNYEEIKNSKHYTGYCIIIYIPNIDTHYGEEGLDIRTNDSC